MEEACQSPNDQWIKEFSRLFPEKVCEEQIGVLECGTATPTYCIDKYKLQDCSEEAKEVIYEGNKPSGTYIGLIQYLEKEYQCTGYCGKCRGMYLYTDCRRTEESSIGCEEALVEVIRGNIFD
eukprot:TRINITY_DN121390_c0_g1_i1.p10 TRINITY_DN121390_c0_g1~~TRINITY_DN121390_c0_g1_i1.p10  ORF type:complete len:123 (+),score=15.01 TRINITY_DN121390_c0_g1_i1:2565-2933(+)